MNDIRNRSLEFHKKNLGKVSIESVVDFETQEDLGLVYTPGMAYASQEIAEDKTKVNEYTMKPRSVAVVSDGSAILGLGNIGPEAGLPVMEGKALIFKKFAGLDAFPLCIESKSVDETVRFCEMISPTFGAIHLEDIKAPECFEIENRLKENLNIPVLHDDQHGTAVVVLAGIINALKVTGKDIGNCKILINGAGAAGTAIAKILIKYGAKDLFVLDSKGGICSLRDDLNAFKSDLLEVTNPENRCGTLEENIIGCDVFIGVSKAGLLTTEMVKSMSEDPIIFALANPIPEIGYEEAIEAGAAVVATGRADYPNQVNNVLAFPGLFKGILASGKQNFTMDMFVAAAKGLASMVETPSRDNVIPEAFMPGVAEVVAKAVESC